ncbi:hypothetical protein GXW78_07475 [Roseomonas terrae]|uniref:Uncharacterized protein n=1 Tax=Neoroseomonas terrae TaxID=424799 RepID=A0ABS5EEP3_9PROT|nr:hypothetical protein [Neoroseomonas terrae]MBR0649494.1 hypothetical protein [Neoroseomonas terrae]
MNLAPIMDAAVLAAAGAVTALAGLLIRSLPLLLRYLSVQINGADTTLIRHAIENAAQLALEKVRQGLGSEVAIQGMADYVAGALPETTQRVGIARVTLEQMCRAAFARKVAAGDG